MQSYCLINCQLGSEEKLFKKLKESDSVIEVKSLFGAYDLIIRVKAPNSEAMSQFLTNNLRKLDYVKSTVTLTELPDPQ